MIEEIKTDNENLNAIIETYFIACSGIKEPKIGVSSFKDIEEDFKYSLREYSITHSDVCEPWQNKTLEELLWLNKITGEDLDTMIKKINVYLSENHTDSQWGITKKKNVLKKQINAFVGNINYDDFTETSKIRSILYDEDEFEAKKNHYLDSVLKAMLAAEVNQVKDNKYLVVEKFLDTYRCYKTYMTTNEFYEKKKYLLKLKPKHRDKVPEKQKKLDTQIKALKKYIDSMYDNNPDYIDYVRWFIAYLFYDSHEMQILMIHMALGYKTEEIRKLYIKLFCKDKSTGKKSTFLHHIDFLNITEGKLYETIEDKYTIPNNKKNRDDIQKLAKKDKNITYTVTTFTIHIVKKEVFKDMPIYSSVINSLNFHYSKNSPFQPRI